MRKAGTGQPTALDGPSPEPGFAMNRRASGWVDVGSWHATECTAVGPLHARETVSCRAIRARSIHPGGLVATCMSGCTEQDYKIGKVQTGAGDRPASASHRALSTLQIESR